MEIIERGRRGEEKWNNEGGRDGGRERRKGKGERGREALALTMYSYPVIHFFVIRK